MHARVHEEHVGALTVSNLESRHIQPFPKYYAITYHCICEQIPTRKIKLIKIASEDQLGSTFTKGHSRISFDRLRKKLMNWYLLHLETSSVNICKLIFYA